MEERKKQQIRHLSYEFSRLRLKQEFTDEGDFSVNSGLLKKTENLRARYPEDIAVRL